MRFMIIMDRRIRRLIVPFCSRVQYIENIIMYADSFFYVQIDK